MHIQQALVESAPENRPRTVCMDDVTAFLGMIMYKFIDSIPTSVPENERLAQWQVCGAVSTENLVNMVQRTFICFSTGGWLNSSK